MRPSGYCRRRRSPGSARSILGVTLTAARTCRGRRTRGAVLTSAVSPSQGDVLDADRRPPGPGARSVGSRRRPPENWRPEGAQWLRSPMPWVHSRSSTAAVRSLEVQLGRSCGDRGNSRIWTVRTDPVRPLPRLPSRSGTVLRAVGSAQADPVCHDPVRRRIHRVGTCGSHPRSVAGLALRSQTAPQGAGEGSDAGPAGKEAGNIAIGDRVWFSAEAGELCERFDHVYVVEADGSRTSVPTYRGEGRSLPGRAVLRVGQCFR